VRTKQKRTQKQSYKTQLLLPETEDTLMFQQMTYIDAYINYISVTCTPHNAKTTIGRYQLAYWPIPTISNTADTDCRPIIGASLDITNQLTHSEYSSPVMSFPVNLLCSLFMAIKCGYAIAADWMAVSGTCDH